MGLPTMKIIFVTKAQETASRAERGVVGMIVKDTVPDTNPITVFRKKDIPTTVSAVTKEQINFALTGNNYSPNKVVVYVLPEDAEDYTEALEYFEKKRVNWLCCPTVSTDGQADAIVEWVKEQREERNKVKAVLPETAADHEAIVNYATKNVKIGETEYTAEGFCSRIAGLIAGTPTRQGVTNASLMEVTECEKLEKEELDKGVEEGKFLIFYDGEKAKVVRAVNSLTKTLENKSEAWKKIRIVETMDMIYDDLIMLVEDNYIGKYPNTYDNKCLLLSAINAYLGEISQTGLIEDYVVDFDIEKIRDYIVENKSVSREAAESMTDAEIKKQYTDDKVFLTAQATITDVMEDITLSIEV